ncbi:hypothetical protein ABL78_0042 [Leptomonas seymouri]|uniref:YqaJ viral recombinase domain-containing protein n=1 Tax=Leptomonas seymouri TaxID=5684 RepID=A0A0N0P983_LEPSE|nr:hypothetical protein ABL78_0042 [Leptomonas seymouri]|eukprot:KPI90809.1 hypothetical protein ABL78_0042 [Leptomonas seymouri]
MAQHPCKLQWKDEHPYGLSASQFGMALGFCGRVSDYVHYLRYVVGTEKEFKGNACTAHGIMTESKSRALYELLTGCQVHDGGFFVTEDRVLGCSPDGQIFYPAEETPIEQQGHLDAATTMRTASCSMTTRSSGDGFSLEGQKQKELQRSECSVRITFNGKRRARSPLSTTTLLSAPHSPVCGGVPSTKLRSQGSNLTAKRISPSSVAPPLMPSPTTGVAASSSLFNAPTRRNVRLLEIKSPFRGLYDCTKPGYEPFGIPLQYMCQIQGQLSIANCDECDFFVYLDHPTCQVEAWRVRRSREFWRWAEPCLRQVSEWVREGSPDWLNRSFAFPPFDFNRIEVTPLVFPYDITAGRALDDARRFSFFAKHPSPYVALERFRATRGRSSANLSNGDVLSDLAPRKQCCHDYTGASWSGLTEYERIAVAVQCPVVRYLFNTNNSDEGHTIDAQSDDDAMQCACISGGGRFCQTLSVWRYFLESVNCYEGSATAELWRSLTLTASAGRDPLVELIVSIPEDWEVGCTSVHCKLLSRVNVVGSASDACQGTTSIEFFQRSLLVSLIPVPKTKYAVDKPLSLAMELAPQCAYAVASGRTPIFPASTRTFFGST